jgi:threonine/homoserine/homoserine lactone efflux protein
MQTDGVRISLIAHGSRRGTAPRSIFAKVGTFAAACVALTLALIALALAFVFSLLVLAVVATGGLTLLGYLWWKLRKQMEAHSSNGCVVEGEVIRDTESGDPTRPVRQPERGGPH